MGRIAQRSARAQDNLEIIESALERTQSALKAAEKADLAVGKAAKKSGKVFKLLLLVSVVGVTVLVIRKLTAKDDAQPTPRHEPLGQTPAAPPAEAASAPPAEASTSTAPPTEATTAPSAEDA